VSLTFGNFKKKKAKKSLYSWIINKPSHGKSLRDTFLYLSGSFTIEAAIVIPLFLMISVGIFLFSRIMIVEWGVACSLDAAARTIAMAGDITDSLEQVVGEKIEIEEEDGEKLELATVILLANEQMLENDVPLGFVENGALGIDYQDSEVTDQEINLLVHYHVKMPFPLFSNADWEISQNVRVHRWVGYDPEEDENSIRYVYVTEYGEAYHLDRNCTYLNPSIRTISRSELESERSNDGGKYNACSICGDHGEAVLYVTDWGESYHSSLSCSGLKRSVKVIPYEEAVESYHACAKCGGE
jgi:hypothetical protein